MLQMKRRKKKKPRQGPLLVSVMISIIVGETLVGVVVVGGCIVIMG